MKAKSELEGYTPVLQNSFEKCPDLGGMERVFVSYGDLANGAV